MATNHYFSNYNAKYTDQRIVEDLIVETIKIMGFDAFYLPNDNDTARDLLYGEDPVKKFNTAFPLEMYLSNTMDYLGEKEFFSKFGLEIKNNVNVIVSKRSFTERVPQNLFSRPREGDLIYVPFLNGTGELFEIKFTNQNKDMAMLGRQVPFFYELELEKFRYSQEIISTGVPDIDIIVTDSAYTISFNVAGGNAIDYAPNELVYQSPDATFANATTIATSQTWNKVTNELTVTNIAGEFVDGNIIYGATSLAAWTLSSYDPLNVMLNNETYDNQYINQQANNISDITETNPFGSI
jgi:hypothetical protein